MDRTVALASSPAVALAGHACGQTDAQVAARLTRTLHVCEDAPGNGGTFEQAICYRDEAAWQDKRLNETWASIVGKLSSARPEDLRRDEHQWIKVRDKDCRDQAADYVNSTANFIFNACVTDQTIRRTLWLEAYTAPLAPVASSVSDNLSGTLRTFLRSYVGEAAGFVNDASKTRYAVAWKDLNGDGRQEAIVYLSGKPWCGSGGCTLLVLEQYGGGFRLRGRVTITQTPIGVLPSTTLGWNDLVVGVGGGGVRPGQVVLPYGGERYAGNPTIPPARPLGPNEAATTLIEAEGRGAVQ